MGISSSSLSVLVTVVFGTIWMLAVASWFAMVVYGFKAVRHPRSGVLIWSRATLWNPANALLRSEFLTEEGQRYRSRCFRALLVFVASVGSLLFVGALTGTLR